MNNKTVKKMDITIKLRGDNVYDLYFNGNWISSHGSCEHLLNCAEIAIKENFK